MAIFTTQDREITGTDQNDLLIQIEGDRPDPGRLEGGGGNDLIYGDFTRPFIDDVATNATAETAMNLDDPAFWTTTVNGTLDETTAPRTSVLGTGTETREFYSVTVGAGERLLLNADYVKQQGGDPADDSLYVKLYRSTDPSGSITEDDPLDRGALYRSGSFFPYAYQDFLVGYTNRSDTDEQIVISLYAYPDAPIPVGSSILTTLSVTGHAATDMSLPSPDTLIGGDGDDTLFGGGGDDQLDGAAGDDFLSGGTGADTMNGGEGRDTLRGGADADVMTGGEGRDTLQGQGGNDLLEGGAGRDSLFGDSGHDTLYAQDGGGSMDGGSGNDWVFGGDDRDNMRGGSGNDHLEGGGLRDVLRGGTGSDHLNGGSDNDRLEGETGSDTINGGSGNDILWGRNEYPYGNSRDADDDWLDGGSGNDTLHGQYGQDSLFGGTGHDLLHGGRLTDTLDGGRGNDTLSGGAGWDLLLGGKGVDDIYGGSGHDTLVGGEGNDRLAGGSGRDVFAFAADWGADVIDDFDAYDGEKIAFAATTGITDFDDLVANHLRDVNGAAVIYAGDDTILLRGLTLSDIGEGLAWSADDFLFGP